MDNKLDPTIENIINQTYTIDSSILRQIEERNQISNSAKSSMLNVINGSPKKIEEPIKTDSPIKNIDQNLDYEYKLKEKELNDTLGFLAELDIQIDEVDGVIQKIDKQALELISEINSAINDVKTAYEERINVGCKNDLIWTPVVPFNGLYNGNSTKIDSYVAIKSVGVITSNYYGIKYYQKPSNRDYGFNVISEFNGTISIGSSLIAVLIPNSINDIQEGDRITDNVDGSSAFPFSALPIAVGVGTTTVDVLGIVTSQIGYVSSGTTAIGIGSTANISIGQYLINESLFSTDTKVVGFGTTVVQITYADTGSTVPVTIPSIKLSNSAIGIGTNVTIGFGTYTKYPAINLNVNSSAAISNGTFSVIRLTEDITKDFDYTKSPLDPVKIGIVNSNKIGLGHKSTLISNGESSKPANWREVLNRPEPLVGNEKATYYSGNTSWPIVQGYGYGYGYAQEGVVYTFTDGGTPTYTSVSPTGKNPSGAICVAYGNSCTYAENKLEEIKQRNLPQIEKLVAASNYLRRSRDKDELKAWSYLQSASYTRLQLNELQESLNSIRSVDYDSL